MIDIDEVKAEVNKRMEELNGEGFRIRSTQVQSLMEVLVDQINEQLRILRFDLGARED